jgi:hypothetical protein
VPNRQDVNCFYFILNAENNPVFFPVNQMADFLGKLILFRYLGTQSGRILEGIKG